MCLIPSAKTRHHSLSNKQQMMKTRLLEKEQGAGPMGRCQPYCLEPWEVLILSAPRQKCCQKLLGDASVDPLCRHHSF